jgi:tetrahydromethanopterin S-methyltransferase subunit G
MSEESTQNIPDSRSFEERVFARFDAMDARLDSMDRRLEALETKPIWERALAEILEVKEGLYNVERKLDVLSSDIVKVRADQGHLGRRLDKLESKPTQ